MRDRQEKSALARRPARDPVADPPLDLPRTVIVAVFSTIRTRALRTSVTVIAIVTLGCVIGAMAPLVLHRLGIDPATSSTPLIASTVDVLGIIVYLSLASVVLTVFNSVGAG